MIYTKMQGKRLYVIIYYSFI